MGAESGEWRQFRQGSNEGLDLDAYERDVAASRVRAWWNKLCELRRGNTHIEGPAPLRVHYAQDGMLAFSRGEGGEWFVVLNFSDRAGERSRLGLDPERPTGLVLFGGHGSKAMIGIAQRLAVDPALRPQQGAGDTLA